MNKVYQALSILLLVFLFGCNQGDHFISDKNYRQKVQAQFDLRKEFARHRKAQLFGVFDEKISGQEREALQFLYAYMPLSDLADYDGEFYLRNVRTSFAARDTFSWGKKIPENLFRHFVLPVRVNNENLDSSRWVFFPELKNRIKHLSMKDAALEVNHWCHEKVTYKGSDERTSSPLATVKNAYGRCGEESTFTVAALRAACIPARQCYTPRWAHSDDNHAWVEVWIDGKWHYMGACEPEPDLDMAWFTGPAKRAMLVNTNVFGDYDGPEEVLVRDPLFTRINVLSNYASTKKLTVTVTGASSQAIENATVEFQLYNYAEFYPLQRCVTGNNGQCSFTTGFGDLLVWAAKGNTFGYRKVSAGEVTTTIVLNRNTGETFTEDYDFVPPPEKTADNIANDSMISRNTKRFAFEDRVRSAYENTFIDSVKSIRLAHTLNLDADSLWQVVHKSRGNWRDLINVIAAVPPDKKNQIFSLLNHLSEKDLHDVTPEVLDDNIQFSRTYDPVSNDKDIFPAYILSPRIDNEYLKPFKELFQKNFDKSFISAGRKDPESIVNWIKKNILIDDKANYGRAPLTPAGVYELRIADSHSRDIFFVAVCRSFGIPARLETATRIPQYFLSAEWHDVYFSKPPARTNARGKLVLNSVDNDRVPEYYTHFTIEKFEDGFFRSLDYETDPVLRSFPCNIDVPAGSYLIVTGNRINGGTVFAKLSFFSLNENETRNQPITLRKNLAPLPDLGKISRREAFLASISAGKYGNRPGILAWIDPEKEPSRHFIADLLAKKSEIDKGNGFIILLFNTDLEMQTFQKKNAHGLPLNTQCIVSPPGTLDLVLLTIHHKRRVDYPVVTYINPDGGINYFSEGYKIGIVDELLPHWNLKN